MKTKWIDSEFAYDGTQLRSLFAYMSYELQGDSAVAWIGPCAIANEHMVDGEDLLAGATIAGDRMVHFIVEKFHTPLIAGVALQRLFAAIVLDYLREMAPMATLRREGDDIYVSQTGGEGKLSISIATVSPISTLIHFAVNCINNGTPVRTASLGDLAVEPRRFAIETLARLAREVRGIEEATVKVRWVK